MSSTVKCDGAECGNQLDVSSQEKYPDGACAIEIHVKQGSQYLRMQAKLCPNCTSEKLMKLFAAQEAES